MAKRIKKVFLIRPPRERKFFQLSGHFLPPLGLTSVAAAIREGIEQSEVRIIDCEPLRVGWDGLRRIIAEERPDVVGAGDNLVYYADSARLFAMVKEIDSAIITIAGGHFFSWKVEYSLERFKIDYIVRFEAEEGMVDLLSALAYGRDVSGVSGVSFRREGRILSTSLRPLIEDLDRLPFPAYDLLPLSSYPLMDYVWPHGFPLEHSRGCVDQCSFCGLWTFWGRQKNSDIEHAPLEVAPCYRSKSVERALAEVDMVYNKYKGRYIFWVDPTFNVDSCWSEAFCDGLISRNYKDLRWAAFMRADFLIRDESRGVLEKMVKSGLVSIFFGVERETTDDLKALRKSNCSRDTAKEAFGILEKKYPQVIRQASFLLFPSDTWNTLVRVVRYAHEIDADFVMLLPLIYFPGTYLYQDEIKSNSLKRDFFEDFKWDHPVLRSQAGLTSDDLIKMMLKAYLLYALSKPWKLWDQLCSPYASRRLVFWRFYMSYLGRGCMLGVQWVLNILRVKPETVTHSRE